MKKEGLLTRTFDKLIIPAYVAALMWTGAQGMKTYESYNKSPTQNAKIVHNLPQTQANYTKPFHENEKYVEKFVQERAPSKKGKLENISEEEPQIESPRNKGVVVLDPGHGYGNVGNRHCPGTTTNGYKESKLVLERAKKVREMLENIGYEVYLTREDENTPTPLKERATLAKKLNADIFVSLHNNAVGSTQANGYETCYLDSEDKKAAQIINDSILKEVRNYANPNARDRGVKHRSNLRVLKDVGKIPAVLIEAGFQSNPQDLRVMTDNINDIEQGIAEGIHKYLQSRK